MHSRMRLRCPWLVRLSQLGLALALILSLSLAGPARADGGTGGSQHHPVNPAPVALQPTPSKPIGAPARLKTARVQPSTVSLQGIHALDPVDLKVLVVAAEETETNYQAITAFLKQAGIPFQTLIARQTPLTANTLWDGVRHGYYQAVVLTTGNLIYENPPGSNIWQSAFDDGEWQTLWQYEAMFGVRQVTMYTIPGQYPDAYGLGYVGYLNTIPPSKPLAATLTPAGQAIFPYLNPATPVTIQHAWAYPGAVLDPSVTTPLLVTAQNYAIASVTRYPDGRENLTLNVDNNPYLFHSMLLSYGIINWATRGLFLGERHVNMNVQVDDLLIESDLWDTGALTDTTGLTYRLNDQDFLKLISWQKGVRASYPTLASGLTLEHAFNMEGASGIYSPDTLTPVVIANQANFSWVNHTYNHANLDTVTAAQATTELKKNHNQGLQILRFTSTNYYKDALVQPDISGLNNPNFLSAARAFGIRYLIADTSRPEWNNPSPNAGFYSQYQPSILIIPRRPSNLFYNLTTPAEWVSEYNCFYGPSGICAGGAFRYWDHNLTYAEILDRESDMLLSYWLKWDLDPLMFHQANLRAYDGRSSLLGDLIGAALAKYKFMYNLPIRNLNQHQLGLKMAERMAYDASGVTATLNPCRSLVLKSTKAAVVPVTGASYGTNRETYGGQTISYVKLGANQTLSIPVPACPR